MNFIKLYNEFTSDTEPPTNYHLWTMISTISALLGRRCFIPQGTFAVYPALYVILVGIAGMRKSSAMNIGKDLLLTLADFPLAPASTTREALLEALQNNVCNYEINGKTLQYHQISAFVTEMSDFIGGKHRNQGMLDILTALWEEKRYEYVPKNSAKVYIESPYLTLMGCCTTEWLGTQLKSSVITDGLARRIIFVKETERKRYEPFPKLTTEQRAAWEQLKVEAAQIRNVSGQFDFTDDALAFWHPFYIQLQKDAERKEPTLQHYFTSKHILILKVAMCLSVVLRGDMYIDEALLRIVGNIFDDMEYSLPEIFASMGRNEFKTLQDRIELFITEGGPSGRLFSDVMKHFSSEVTYHELMELMITLTSSASVKNVTPEDPMPRYVSVTEKVSRKRPDLFQQLLSYKPSTPISNKKPSQEIDLGRLITADGLRKMQEQETKKENLKKGILLTGIRSLPPTDYSDEGKTKASSRRQK